MRIKAGLTVTALACDLHAWLQLLALQGAALARATPKTLRCCFLYFPAASCAASVDFT
ncbi:hypothetical protein [Streptomyces murinus]|uniref:hypothetical protein n=1 Tax=Streptomyces murinus TaxID=33900 RepID=UPI003F474D3A